MPVAGDNNIGAGALGAQVRGRYVPQLRMYFEDERHGLLCDVFDLPFLGKPRSRDEAIRLGREWMKRPGADRAAEEAWDIAHNWRVMGIPEAQVKSRIREKLTA